MAGCGGKPYSFKAPVGFKDSNPKDYRTALGKVPGDNQTLLVSNDRGVFDFIRVYTATGPQRVDDVNKLIDQTLPVLDQIGTKLVSRTQIQLAGEPAVRLELEPADVLGRQLGSWLTIATRGRTGYFVQCQWQRKPEDRAFVTRACDQVLRTFKLG